VLIINSVSFNVDDERENAVFGTSNAEVVAASLQRLILLCCDIKK